MKPKLTKIEKAKQVLWKKGSLSWKFGKHDAQHEIYNNLRNLPKEVRTAVCLISRRWGKCIAKGTEVATPTGPIAIEKLKVGDYVIGYDGKPTKVLAVHYNGIRPVVDIVSHNKTIAQCTKEHVWLAKRDRKYVEELKTSKLKVSSPICRRFSNTEIGTVTYPYAYSLGAMLGDGCCSKGMNLVNTICISSKDNLVPDAVMKELGAYSIRKGHHSNYSWILSNGYGKPVFDDKLYIDWCKDKKAHEKYTDLEVIETWNRDTALRFLAGLYDTDGSVTITKDNALAIHIGMQSKSTIEAIARLIYKLYQKKLTIYEDSRDKYKNGSVYSINIKNNYLSKALLKDIDKYVVTKHKKYKEDYDNLRNYNINPDSIGCHIVDNNEIAHVYDITVDNDKSLYCLHNEGLITHNSYLECVMALEDCLRNPMSQVFIIAPSLKHASLIVAPLILKITQDAPTGLIRRTKSQYCWECSNKSKLILGSFDTVIESIRGSEAFAIYIEETGFTESIDDYDYIISSVLFPTLLHGGGRITHFTTPPKILNHPFILSTLPQAEKDNALYVRDIYTNKLLTHEQIEQEKETLGGASSVAWQREMLCKIVRDDSLVVVPEFKESHVAVADIKLPEKYNTWIAGDLGGTIDRSAIYLMAYDFLNDTTMVLREVEYNNKTPLSAIAVGIKKLMSFNPAPSKIYIDASGQTLTDLRVDYDILASLPKKDSFEAGINTIRHAFSQNSILIDPSCKFLITSLKNGIFTKNRKDFLRTEALGHLDAIAALIYGYRARIKDNPYPVNYNKDKVNHYINQEDYEKQNALKNAFGFGL